MTESDEMRPRATVAIKAIIPAFVSFFAQLLMGAGGVLATTEEVAVVDKTVTGSGDSLRRWCRGYIVRVRDKDPIARVGPCFMGTNALATFNKIATSNRTFDSMVECLAKLAR